MKVSELIAQLQKFDPDFEVVVLAEAEGEEFKGVAWTDNFEPAQYEDTEFVYLEPIK